MLHQCTHARGPQSTALCMGTTPSLLAVTCLAEVQCNGGDRQATGKPPTQCSPITAGQVPCEGCTCLGASGECHQQCLYVHNCNPVMQLLPPRSPAQQAQADRSRQARSCKGPDCRITVRERSPELPQCRSSDLQNKGAAPAKKNR
jgi:hypothetical protein